MIKRQTIKDYEYKHPLGMIVTDAEVGISPKGRRSLSVSEIGRLSRLAAIQFLENKYRASILDDDFSLSAKEIRAIIALLKVNQTEFSRLIGCQRAKLSKILSDDQEASKSQAQLALERLSMELASPGSARRLLGDSQGEVLLDKAMQERLSALRYGLLKSNGF